MDQFEMLKLILGLNLPIIACIARCKLYIKGEISVYKA